MNAIETLYRNAGLVTEDDYIKVRDGLWVKSGPYEKQSWHDADKSILPTKEELKEIYLKLQEIVQIQESCGLESLRRILNSNYSWAWSSIEYNDNYAWLQQLTIGNQDDYPKHYVFWIVPVKRSV